MVALVFSEDAHADTTGICMSLMTVKMEDSGASMSEVLGAKHETCWLISLVPGEKWRGSLDKTVVQALKLECFEKNDREANGEWSATVEGSLW